jgi:hypothetical protein
MGGQLLGTVQQSRSGVGVGSGAYTHSLTGHKGLCAVHSAMKPGKEGQSLAVVQQFWAKAAFGSSKTSIKKQMDEIIMKNVFLIILV